MRPVLKPALRRLWRDGATLQLGQSPRFAVVIGGVDEDVRGVLRLLDGSLDRPGVLAAARRNGVPVPRTQRLLDLLAQGGALDDATVDTRPLRSLGTLDRRRLAPDLASLSLQRPEPGAALAALSRRQAAAVEVVGAGRVGAPLASHLAAAGVGRIHVRDEGTTRAPTSPSAV